MLAVSALTGMKVGGKNILIALDMSASMLDDNIVNVLRRRNMSDERKRAAADDRKSEAPVKAEGGEESPAAEEVAKDIDQVAEEVIEEKSRAVKEAPLPVVAETEQASDESNKQTADADSADA